MTVQTFAARILVILAMLLSGATTPSFAQHIDNVRGVLKEGFAPQSLPHTTDWGSINSVVLPERRNIMDLGLPGDRPSRANKRLPVRVDPLDPFGFKNYLMSKSDTQACRFLVEMDMFSSCPPLEIILVNPENITEFITISKEVKAGYLSKSFVEKTLLPELIKNRQEIIGDETIDGMNTKIALIEPPAFTTEHANPRISFKTQMVIDNGSVVLRYFEQNVYVLTRHGYIGINIINTKFLDKKQIDEIIDRIIGVDAPHRYEDTSMFDFNSADIKAEDFLIFE
ncbi:hypothetical protein [Brucella thiophenivorans]|nr:hypothetical protein [Brucella thiophenivorans]